MISAAELDLHALLAALPARAKTRLAGIAQHCVLAAGETSNVAEVGGVAVFVTSGNLRASFLADGRIVFQDLAAGEALGVQDAILGRDLPPSALLALSDVQAIVVPAAPAMEAISANAAAASALAVYFASALEARSSGGDPLQSVYRDLLRAAKPKGDTIWTIDPLPRHRELAQRAGVAEEEAATAIANLVRLGVARRRYPALDIEDREALRELSI